MIHKRIPQEFINELLARCDIVEFVDQRVKLKKTGSNYSARCPFHDEKSPSFTVSSTKQFYHCFGCGAHGNLLGFLMAYDHLEFIEAVEALAQYCGLDMPELAHTQEVARHEPLYALLEKVMQHYHAECQRSTKAQAYLRDRGLSESIIQKFQIGFAPNSWQYLTESLKPTPNVVEALQQSGMLIKNETGKLYDRFRNRIMFPIRDYRGRVIGFGGRSLDDTHAPNSPKYLNSPETILFHKGNELFGLYEARQHKSRCHYILVVEGYMDVIALHQFGIQTAVATLGTATTAKHLQVLFRLSQDIIFCFDGDRAGSEAAWRALEVCLPLLQDGLSVRFLFLPSGEDPDSMIRRVGTQIFEQHLLQATPLADFFFDKLCAQTHTQTLEGKAKLAYIAKNLIKSIRSGVFQQLMWERLAQLIGTSNPLSLMESQSSAQPKRTKSPGKQDVNQPLSPVQKIIALLLQYPHIAQHASYPRALNKQSIPGMDIIQTLFDLLKQHPHLSTGAILEHWRDSKLAGRLGALASRDLLIPTEGALSELQASLQAIQRQSRKMDIEQLISKSKQGTLSSIERETLLKLLKEQHENTNSS